MDPMKCVKSAMLIFILGTTCFLGVHAYYKCIVGYSVVTCRGSCVLLYFTDGHVATGCSKTIENGTRTWKDGTKCVYCNEDMCNIPVPPKLAKYENSLPVLPKLAKYENSMPVNPKLAKYENSLLYRYAMLRSSIKNKNVIENSPLYEIENNPSYEIENNPPYEIENNPSYDQL